MRFAPALLVAALTVMPASHPAAAGSECPARVVPPWGGVDDWHQGPEEDSEALTAWCRAVGPPLSVNAAPAAAPPAPLDELVVLTWNTHLGAGRLDELIDDLRAGRLTDGRPVSHFVLLLQELVRRGDAVPPFEAGARAAHAIAAGSHDVASLVQTAARLGLDLLYVPSMRNGVAQREDRGSAIVSSEPLQHTLAIELPFERQRRVALGASLRVRTDAGTRDLQVLNVHLEPLSSPGSLWLFKNPRKRQIGTVLAWLNGDQRSTRRLMAGVVLGGDLNTIQGGDQEPAYARVRRWSHSLATEDVRPTHRLGRLDYLFARLAPGWQATTTRVDARYGSDHHPVLARFERGSAPPDGFQGRTGAPPL